VPASRAVVARSALLLLATACGGAPTPPAAATPEASRRTEPADPPAATARAQPARQLVWAWLSDARGLAVGARVVVAGLPVGEIAAIRSGRHGTRVDIALPPEQAVWSNARLSKRPTHVAGEYRLELDPGDEPTGAEPARFAARRLADGEEIADVVEEASVEALIEGIDEQLPGR
jgi:ABC-type transporter Mla subunit MlaD